MPRGGRAAHDLVLHCVPVGALVLILLHGRDDDDETLHVDDRGSPIFVARSCGCPGRGNAGVAGADGSGPRADAGQIHLTARAAPE